MNCLSRVQEQKMTCSLARRPSPEGCTVHRESGGTLRATRSFTLQT